MCPRAPGHLGRVPGLRQPWPRWTALSGGPRCPPPRLPAGRTLLGRGPRAAEPLSPESSTSAAPRRPRDRLPLGPRLPHPCGGRGSGCVSCAVPSHRGSLLACPGPCQRQGTNPPLVAGCVETLCPREAEPGGPGHVCWGPPEFLLHPAAFTGHWRVSAGGPGACPWGDVGQGRRLPGAAVDSVTALLPGPVALGRCAARAESLGTGGLAACGRERQGHMGVSALQSQQSRHWGGWRAGDGGRGPS